MLLWMAWRTATQAVATEAAALPSRSDLLRCFAGTFVLTLSNPATIVSFIAVFAAMAGGGAQRLSAAPMVAGVWLGSALWWLGLTTVVGRLREERALGPHGVKYVLLSHNTKMGAAQGALLTAEQLLVDGYFR